MWPVARSSDSAATGRASFSTRSWAVFKISSRGNDRARRFGSYGGPWFFCTCGVRSVAAFAFVYRRCTMRGLCRQPSRFDFGLSFDRSGCPPPYSTASGLPMAGCRFTFALLSCLYWRSGVDDRVCRLLARLCCVQNVIRLRSRAGLYRARLWCASEARLLVSRRWVLSVSWCRCVWWLGLSQVSVGELNGRWFWRDIAVVYCCAEIWLSEMPSEWVWHFRRHLFQRIEFHLDNSFRTESWVFLYIFRCPSVFKASWLFPLCGIDVVFGFFFPSAGGISPLQSAVSRAAWRGIVFFVATAQRPRERCAANAWIRLSFWLDNTHFKWRFWQHQCRCASPSVAAAISVVWAAEIGCG